MRIAYVAPRYPPYVGGVETHVARVAARVAARGHDVEVLTQQAGRDLPPGERVDGVTVRRFPVVVPIRHAAHAPGLWSHLRRHGDRYDVVHAHNYHALPALGAALTARRPLVFSPHYHGAGGSALRDLLHRPYRALGAAIIDRSSAIICDSAAEAALIGRHFPRGMPRVTIIPNGVDVAEIRAAEPYPYPLDRTVILSVGRLERYKNVHMTLDALARLDDGYMLAVIGDGPMLPALCERAARLGVAGRVLFLGRIDTPAVHRWLRTAAVCVGMSSQEAFGITVLEALAAGAGVVASAIPAHREITRGRPPELVALAPLSSSPAALARAIAAVARRRRVDGAAGSPGDIASWDVVAARTLRLYAALIDGRRACYDGRRAS